MSRNHPMFAPEKPTELTLETLPQLFAHHRALYGGWTMTQTPPEGGATPPAGGAGGQEPPEGATPPERPEGISDEEWTALGDPGRAAIVRERERAQAAERALAAARARPTPPAKKAAAAPPPAGQPPAAGEDAQPDIGAIVREAVTSAIKPFQDAEEQRTADAAANLIQTAVLDAAKTNFLDPTDALLGIDLTQVTDGAGNADSAKIKDALDGLLTRKPHLGKVPDDRRHALPGAGAGGSTTPLDDRVKDTLRRMQESSGIKPS